MSATGDPRERSRVGVIVGSTRPTRIGPGIARWVLQALGEDSPLAYELIDLVEVNLPLLDEPLRAALQQYKHAHTLAWSETISSYDGFVVVSPQYNWGYPAPLKNALDYLYKEWGGKPVALVTYGARGGGKSAEQLRGVFQGLHMQDLDCHVEVVIAEDAVDDDWQLIDINAVMHPYRAQTRQIDAQMVEALTDTQE